MQKLDHIDWGIIKLLNEDGRMPSTEIERRLGNVSARTINNRIDALVNNGIINIRAVLNPDMVGFGVMAEVFIEAEQWRLRDVVEMSAKFPQVSYAACTTGEKDVIISVRARSIEELFDFITEELGKIPGVRHTKSYLMPVKIKASTRWIPEDALEDGSQDER